MRKVFFGVLALLGSSIGWSAPVIDVWYGDSQSFGALGNPQRWVNIVGNVSDDSANISNLYYSLNGGSYVGLRRGTQNPRLELPGDFNIDIDIQDLFVGQNIVEISAVNSLNVETVRVVYVNYTAGASWPTTYTIDWANTTNIQDVAQVVDGKWAIEGGAVRTVESGYDRLIAIGDMSWFDYEIEVPITINAVDPDAFQPGIGLLARWDGHYQWGVEQPNTGWWPMGALAWYRYDFGGPGQDKFSMVGNEGHNIDLNAGKNLAVGVTYIYKMRVETPEGEGSWYRLKVWEQGTPEPSGWDLEAQEKVTDPQNGSFLLLAHYVDASFGNVQVTPLASNNDGMAPVISNVSAAPSYTQATISWTTNKPSNSVIYYGANSQYGSVVTDNALSTAHSMTLIGLDANTDYHFQVASTDYFNMTGVSNDQVFTTVEAPNGGLAASDDFNDGELSSVWSVVDPRGDGTVTESGTQLSLSVGGGVSHDVWNNTNNALRVVQSTVDGDFEAEVKFDSLPGSKYQLQGLLIEQDSSNFIRMDFFHDGKNLRLFAASFTNGSASIKTNTVIASGSPLYMRVKREGNSWFQSYSYDGQSWSSAASFSRALVNSSVSIFAGNAGTNPAFTAVVDSFAIASGSLPTTDTQAPTISNIAISNDGSNATISWQTSEAVESLLSYGETINYELGTAGSSSLTTNHSVTLSGLQLGVAYHVQITASDEAANTSTSADISWIPSTPQPPVISNVQIAVGSNQATINWATDKPSDSLVEFGLDSNYGSVVTDSALSTSHSVTLTGLSPETLYYLRLTSTGGEGLSSSDSQTFGTSSGPQQAQSDSFDNTELSPVWSIVDPRGDGTVSLSGSQLSLSVGGGVSHDVWNNTNNALRVVQSTVDGDFEAEVKFDSLPDSKFQLQGLLIEQDASNFIRMDFFHDGKNLRLFAANFINGSSSIKTNTVISSGSPLYMRVKREGNSWTQSYSYDGQSWTSAASFSRGLSTSSVSIFAGNAGNNPAFTAVVDSFTIASGSLPTTDTQAPTISNIAISNDGSNATISWQTSEAVESLLSYGETINYELGTAGSGSLTTNHSVMLSGLQLGVAYHVQITASDEVANTSTSADISWIPSTPQPPVISNVQIAVGSNQATINWATDKPSDSLVEFGLDSNYGSVVTDSALSTSHSVTLTGLSPETLYYIRLTSTGGEGLSSSDSQTFGTSSGPQQAQSDSFDNTELNPVWSVVDPRGDGTVAVNGSQLNLSIGAGVSHDVWNNTNNTLRVVQSTVDGDFEAEVKFDSLPDSKYQLQGLLIGEDASNFVRMDFFHDGKNLRLFAASFTNGSASVKFNAVIASGSPLYMRVKREGNTWSQSYSYDGQTWANAASFSRALSASSVSIFAGNAGNSPAFTAIVDSFMMY